MPGMHCRTRGHLPGISVLVCTVLVCATRAAAAVDLVPFAGFRFGGSVDTTSTSPPGQPATTSINSALSYGGVLDVPISGQRAIELYYSRQPTTLAGRGNLPAPAREVTVSMVQAGLVDRVAGEDPRLSWLLIGMLGATILDAAGATDTQASVAIGGGVLWMASEHVGLRADLRALLTFGGGGGGVLICSGGCSATFHTSAFAQGEASLGMVVRF
jgi:hypothetical protein